MSAATSCAAADISNPDRPRKRHADQTRCLPGGSSASEQLENLYPGSATGLNGLLHSAGTNVRTPRGLTSDEVLEAERLYVSGWLLREVGARFRVSTESVRRALLKRDEATGGRGGRKRSPSQT